MSRQLIRCIDAGCPEKDPERWKPIVGYEGRYEISSHGRVKSLGRTETYQRVLNNGLVGAVQRSKCEKILRLGLGSNGYLGARLKGKTFLVHRLVLAAFRGPAPSGFAGCHRDGDRTNNRLDNLRWDTYSANNRERIFEGGAQRRDLDGRFRGTRGRAPC